MTTDLPPLTYRLGDVAARSRARATAAITTLAELAPLLVVVVLLHRLGYAAGVLLYAVLGAVLLLSAVRAGLSYARLSRKLRAFEVTVDGEALVVETVAAKLTASRDDVKRIIEVPGALGGLRVELVAGEPDRVDVPRGGERFGELRAAFESWRAVERPPRRRRVVWIGLAVAFVGAVFFLPFFLDDVVARSRAAVAALVLGTWFALRLFMARRR